MKKLLFLVSVLVIAVAVSAAPVDPTRALQIAQEFVPQQKVSTQRHNAPAGVQKGEIVYTHYMPKSGKPAIYVINIGNAFALVSADDVAHPILGYNYSKSWPIDGNLPPQVKSFFDDLAQQMEAASEHPQDDATAEEWQNPKRRTPKRAKANDNLPDSVGPLLTTTWDQGQYYNALCPEDGQSQFNGHVPTGCVATAMAQIINYWGQKEPIKTRGKHSYESNYGTLEVDFENITYDFAHMPNALSSESTLQELNAVASLMRDCGVAVNMQYSPAESSSFAPDARAAFINFFKMSPDANYAEKAFFSDDEWSTMLKQNIAAGKPVYYAGRNENNSGHAFICNGYQKDGYFYFNFGWSGMADGWYLTNAVLGYTSNQTAILGIQPDSSGNVILGQMQGTSTFVVDEPLEFYHLMGHNAYEGTNYSNPCNSNTVFVSTDIDSQLVLDILAFDNQIIDIYDEPMYSFVRSLSSNNNLSPYVSVGNHLKLQYRGGMFYSGFHLIISNKTDCRMVSNLVASIEDTIIHLFWQENGNSTQWEMEYGLSGFSLGNGTRIVTTSCNCDIGGLEKMTNYDFYVRPICDNNAQIRWRLITTMTDAPYWHDIVFSQPQSYIVDENNNYAYISCAEDFVWYIISGNSNSYKAIFVSDIDMSGYKWKPVAYSSLQLEGNGHVIKNLKIREKAGYAALFDTFLGTIENLGIDQAYIHGESCAGSFCTTLHGRIANSYVSNSIIEGSDGTGGLVENNMGTIENCYANVIVSGNALPGLLTSSSNGIINNCYAAGTIKTEFNRRKAGIAVAANTGSIINCYSISPLDIVGIEGQTIISDTSSFYKTDEKWALNTPIIFDGKEEDNLLEALNRKVVIMNDSTMRIWVLDTNNRNNGLPILGEKFVSTCPNVQNISINNAIHDAKNCVVIDWDEMGDANNWEIKYYKTSYPEDSAKIIKVNTKPFNIYDLSLGQEYSFKVRSLCGDCNSGWQSVNTMVDIPFWTDVISEQPEGFVIDSAGNVEISTAEGLAWLSVLVNGLQEQEINDFNGKIISLTADLNLSKFRWTPIGVGWNASSRKHLVFNGSFMGNGHTISGLYINSEGYNLGLFGFAGYGSIGSCFRDIKLVDGSVNCYYNKTEKGGYGGLLGEGYNIKEIINCYSQIIVRGPNYVGSLCGYIFDEDGEQTLISNCCATGDVYGRESTGGLIGYLAGSIVQNSYATGDVFLYAGHSYAYYRGGLIGYAISESVVRNCYSTGKVEIDDVSNFYGKVIGWASSSTIEYSYGLFENKLPSTPSFQIVDEQLLLDEDILINGKSYNQLLDALNAWVYLMNDPKLKIWALDSANVNGGYPVLSDDFEPSCYNPTNVIVTNATHIGDSTIRTKIEWKQIGNPVCWEILYVSPTQEIDSGIIFRVDSNSCELTNLPVGELIDIYVRAVCRENEKSGWSKPIRYIPDKLHWTEVVTSKPEGYQEDEKGNVLISSAEGLAWLASVMSELNGNSGYPTISNIYLIGDIDLSAYRWTPIKYFYSFLEGNNHTISGLYCNEYDNYQGFCNVMSGTIQNLSITNCSIHGLLYNGILGGRTDGTIRNCTIKGEVYGIAYIGGVGGESYSCSVSNSMMIGNLHARTDVTTTNSYINSFGGIYGQSNNASIINSYVVAEVPQSKLSGVLSGSGNGNIHYSYALKTNGELSLTYDNVDVNSSFFSGNKSAWTLNMSPYINGAFYTDLLLALNAWVNANNSEGIYRHWAADSTNVNGGFPVFAALPKYIVTFQDWDGTVLESQQVQKGCMAIAPPAPERDGYAFIGWDTDFMNVQSDLIVTALFNKATAIGNINTCDTPRKIIRNGQIFILRGEKVYTVTGQEVK